MVHGLLDHAPTCTFGIRRFEIGEGRAARRANGGYRLLRRGVAVLLAGMAAVVDDHLRAAGGQGQGVGATQPLAGAGDDRRATLERG